MAFSSDGKRIVSGSLDKTVKVWDAASGLERLTLRGHSEEVLGVAFSPDGTLVLSGSYKGTLKVWNAGSGEERLSLNRQIGGLASVAFSPDGKRVLSGGSRGDISLAVWDVTSGEKKLASELFLGK